jgi:tRNA (adenine57-N1/adenine58-N1)-methyltransferase catalytic subunit
MDDRTAPDDVSDRARLGAGDAVLFIDAKEREYLRVLRSGSRVHIRDGFLPADQIIGVAEGSTVRNSAGEPFWVVRPTFASLIPNLPRRAQVIYPKDIGAILLWGDIHPGARIIEIGTGPGAMSMAILRAIGSSGHLTSYEVREDFLEMARGNVRQYLGEPSNWTIKLADARQGIEEREVDRMLIDLAEPWILLEQAAAALRFGGVLIAYVPTVLQVKQFVDRARVEGFGLVQVMETFMRSWYVKGLSIRPEHRMIGHTGFIICCRRLPDAAPEIATQEPGGN